MSSLHKQPGRPYWFCSFRGANGRWQFKSTKRKRHTEALEVCRSWEKAAQEARLGRLTPERAREIIATGVADIMTTAGEGLPSSTIRAWCERWVESKRIETEAGTVARYEGITRQFLDSLGTKADRDLATLRVADVTAFRDASAKGLSVASANLSLKVLRVCLGAAMRQGFITTNPATNVPTLKRKKENRRRPLTMAEIRRLLEASGETEWKGLLLAGLYTGQRLGDLARLRWGQVDLPKGLVSFVTEKTGKRLQIPLAKPLQDYFEELPSADDGAAYVFPKTAKAAEKRVGTVSNRFRDLLVEAGLAEPRGHEAREKGATGRSGKRETSELSFHSLRHSATSLLKAAGASDVFARSIIGHDSEAVSRQYTHLDVEDLREAVDKMPDVTTPGKAKK